MSVPPPEVSPDGKFYWDGQKWVAFQGAIAASPAAQPASNSRRGCWIAVAIFVVALVGMSMCVAANAPRGDSPPKPQIDLSGRMTHQATVGSEDAISITVKNNGPGDFETLVIYLNSKDDWFTHHVITDPSGCTINKGLERLECGPFKVGETRTLTIVGSPKDAGNFTFQVSVVDQEGSDLVYPDLDAISWSEAVTP